MILPTFTAEAGGLVRHMGSEQRRQLIREARQRPAPLALVAASLVSAGATIAGLDAWVAIIAAAVALVSGAEVVRIEIVVPARTAAAIRATVPVGAVGPSGRHLMGTAVQYKPRWWVTAAHVVPPEATAQLRLGTDWAEVSVIHRDEAADVAVLRCPRDHPWVAAFTFDVPEQGALVRVVGWTLGAEQRRVRIALDYTLQSETDADELVVTGPNPQPGMGGGPALDLRSGRPLGVLSRFNPGGPQQPHLGSPLQEVYVVRAGRLLAHLQ